MADRQPAFLEHQYAWEEGRALWLDLRVYPMADGALAVFWRDVTARKAAEEALTESEARFVQFAASTTDVLWVRDADTMTLEYISPAFETVFGVTTGAVDGGLEPGAALVDPADRERVMEHLDAARRGEPQTYEFRIVHGSDGGPRWIRDHCFPLIDGVGRVQRIGGIARDVTALKLAEQHLRESEERQAFLLKLSDALRPLEDAAAIERTAVDLLGAELGASKVFYATIDDDGENWRVRHDHADGVPSGIGSDPFTAFQRNRLAGWRQGLASRVADSETEPGFTAEDRAAYAAFGTRAAIGVPLVRAGRFAALLAVNQAEPREWTESELLLVRETAERTWLAIERARAETALRESEQRLATAFESVPAGVAVIDIAGTALLANTQYRRFLPTGIIPSHNPERVMRWRAWDGEGRLLDPQRFPGARALRGETVVPGQEMLFTDDSGREIWTSVATAPVRDAWGRMTGAVSVIQDIDAAKRSAEALRESEERFREFGENSSDALWIVDAETMRLEYLSPAFTRIWGESREKVMADIGRWAELIHPDDRALAAQAMPRSLAGHSHVIDYRIVRPDGDVRWIRDTGFPIREAGAVKRIGGIAQDVTDLKRAEERQRVLLAELQHRVRNTLAVVRSITRRTAQNSHSVEDMGAHLEGRIDAFARVQAMTTRAADGVADLAALIEDELLAHAARQGDQLSVDGPDVALTAKAAEILSLAVHELATNAVKYGALANGKSRLSIRWTIADDRLDFVWDESGLPKPLREPDREGFGFELLRRVIPYELAAETDILFRDRGLRFTVSMPLDGNIRAH